MKKILALGLCAAFAAQAATTICAPSFEAVGMNPDFAVSSARVLDGNMQTNMGKRQLVMPAQTDTVKTTDNLDRQVNWAKGKGCSYLLQTTLTRLGETVQVSATLTDLSSNTYIFKKAYKASSPDDLHPVFQQIGNTLQDDEFASIETIYDVTAADAKSLKKKKSSNYYLLGVQGSYHKEFKELYGMNFGYFIDARTFMGQAVWNIDFSPDDYGMTELGLRIYYPFSKESNSFYIGGGAGLVFTETPSEDEDDWDGTEENYGLLVEVAAGYMLGRTSNFMFRVEGYGSGAIHEGSVGGGVRMILGIGD